nr:Ger(x)C family spore germination protein [Alicyclobacillus dauci]
MRFRRTRLTHRLKRICATVCICVAPLAVTGCYDRQELEQQAFVSVLGVDKAPGGLIDCTFKIAQPISPSGGAGGASGGGEQPLASKTPVTVRAHSIYEAMLLANGSIERTLTFSHLTLIIFGSNVAKSGVLQYIQPLTRYREFRRTVPFAVADGEAKDIIQTFQPMLDTSTARVNDGISLLANRIGLIPNCRLHDLAAALENPHEDVVAPMYGVNKFVKDNKSLPDDSSISYEAGDVRRSGGNPVDWMGGAVFHGDKVVDFVNGEDSIYLRLLEGELDHARLDFQDPTNKQQNIGVELHKEGRAHYDVSLGNPVQIRVNVPVDVDVVNVSSGIDYSQTQPRAKLEKSLSDQLNQRLEGLLHRLLVTDHADVIPVSRYIRAQFPTYQAFQSYPWLTRLKTANIIVNSDIHVRRFGVQIEPLHETT